MAAVLGIVYAAQLKSVGVVVVHEVLTLNGVAEVDHWRGIGKDQLLLLLKLEKAVCCRRQFVGGELLLGLR